MFDPRNHQTPTLTGKVIESQAQRGVTYQLERMVGSGGMGNAYLAKRSGPEGTSLVVVKIVNASLGGGAIAPGLVAMKEAVALGRLNETVPPTPFVVRFVDSGEADVFPPHRSPWTAIEYVQGGVEGTTLEDRVTYSVHKTGSGFDRRRAAYAIRCLADGLTAIHGVGVLHRDLSPGNVLCCGFGQNELFKISDFGIARASGIDFTFQGFQLGTLGYSAPETSEASASPACDVFSFAAIVYYLLTGQQYFEAYSPAEALRKFASKQRPSITDSPALVPELLERVQACQELDRAIARATSLTPSDRPQSAAELAASILPWLGDTQAGPRSSQRLLSSLHDAASDLPQGELSWIVKSRGSEQRVITSAAWDPDGHAFVLSQRGAEFWNGNSFLDARGALRALPFEATFVRRYPGGGWLLGGRGPALIVVDASGAKDGLQAPRADLQFELADGRLDDLLVAVGSCAGEPTTLFCVCARRWVKPIPLPGVANIATLQRLDDTRWLVGGRLRDHGGFVAIYSPLQVELQMLDLPALRAIVAGASIPERGAALLVGTGGVALRFDAHKQAVVTLPEPLDLSAAALDVLDREWTTSVGVLWSRDARRGEPWQAVWRSPNWRAPFVSMMADVGLVTAMTAEGAIIEGRAASAKQPSAPPSRR
jgi:eukaryotic-like serine/threonine-protein kinase